MDISPLTLVRAQHVQQALSGRVQECTILENGTPKYRRCYGDDVDFPYALYIVFNDGDVMTTRANHRVAWFEGLV